MVHLDCLVHKDYLDIRDHKVQLDREDLQEKKDPQAL